MGSPIPAPPIPATAARPGLVSTGYQNLAGTKILSGSLTVTGSITVLGSVTASLGLLNNGPLQVGGNILPSADQTYNLGSAAKSWYAGYFTTLNDAFNGSVRINIQTTQPIVYYGDTSDGVGAMAHKFANRATINTPAGQIAAFYKDNLVTKVAYIETAGNVVATQRLQAGNNALVTGSLTASLGVSLGDGTNYVRSTISQLGALTVTNYLVSTGIVYPRGGRILNDSGLLCIESSARKIAVTGSMEVLGSVTASSIDTFGLTVSEARFNANDPHPQTEPYYVSIGKTRQLNQQNFVSGTDELVIFDSVEMDVNPSDGGFSDGSGNSYEYAAPVSGYYDVTFIFVGSTNDGGGPATFSITVDGSLLEQVTADVSTNLSVVTLHSVVNCNLGQLIAATVNYTGGGGLALQSNPGQCLLYVRLLGAA